MTQLNDLPKDQQIAQIKKQIRIFNVLQFVMPFLMVVMALGVPKTLTDVSEGTKNLVISILCVFAVADFALLRFMIIPQAQKRLAELEGRQ